MRTGCRRRTIGQSRFETHLFKFTSFMNAVDLGCRTTCRCAAQSGISIRGSRWVSCGRLDGAQDDHLGQVHILLTGRRPQRDVTTRYARRVVDDEAVEDHIAVAGKPTSAFSRLENLRRLRPISIRDASILCRSFKLPLSSSTTSEITSAPSWTHKIAICANDGTHRAAACDASSTIAAKRALRTKSGLWTHFNTWYESSPRLRTCARCTSVVLGCHARQRPRPSLSAGCQLRVSAGPSVADARVRNANKLSRRVSVPSDGRDASPSATI